MEDFLEKPMETVFESVSLISGNIISLIIQEKQRVNETDPAGNLGSFRPDSQESEVCYLFRFSNCLYQHFNTVDSQE